MENFDQLYPDWIYTQFPYEFWNKIRGVFSGARMRDHDAACLLLDQIPLNKTDKIRKAHIKTEILRMTAPSDVRLISAACDRYNVALGPSLYSWGKALSKCWNKDHWIFYTSGSHSEDISDWLLNQSTRLGLSFEELTKVLMDEKRQDSHVSAEALRWEHKMMAFMGVPTEITFELGGCIFVMGFTANGIFYCRLGSRNTGDPHTGSGNSSMNGVKCVDALRKALEPYIDIDWSNPPFAVMIQGDDSLVLLDPKLRCYISTEMFIEHSATLGFQVKFVRITLDVTECDYCSRVFYPTDSHPLGYVLAPKIGKVLNKIGFSRKLVPCQFAHNRGIALSLYKDVQHVPFLKEWVDVLLKLSTGYEAADLPFDHSIHSRQAAEPNERTWDFLYAKYNLTACDLADFESSLSYITTLPWYTNMLDVDRLAVIDYQ